MKLTDLVFPQQPWLLRLTALGAGVLYALAFAPFYAWPLAVLAVAVCFALLSQPRAVSGFGLGYCFGLGVYLAGVYWLYYSLHLFGDAIAPLSALITVLFAALMALYYAALGGLAQRLIKGPSLGGALLIWPALWVLVEWVRSWLLTGFPWLSLGYAHTGAWLSGYAPVMGVWAVSLVSALLSACCVLLITRRDRVRWLALGIGCAVCLLGGLLRQVPWSEADGEAVEVALIQPNIAQHQKFAEGFLERSFDIHTELTFQDPHLAALTLWPESAIPTYYDYYQQPLNRVAEAAALRGGRIMTGIFSFNPKTEQTYNSVRLLGKDAEQVYHKSHLVPFGEYIPFRSALSLLESLILVPMSDISPAPSPPSPIVFDQLRIGTSICYEDAFGEEVIRQLPAANLLVNVSNDAWFGDSTAPWQHLQMAQMRSIETARPMLRATNTGVSALIDHRGELLQTLGVNQRGRLRGMVQPQRGATPFVRWSNRPVLGLALMLLVIGVVWQRRSEQ